MLIVFLVLDFEHDDGRLLSILYIHQLGLNAHGGRIDTTLVNFQQISYIATFFCQTPPLSAF